MSLRHVNRRQMTKAVLWVLALGSVGCTSLQFSDYTQPTLVTTQTPGAEIWVGGEKLGVTPAVVDLRRGRKPEIELRYPNQDASRVRLKKRYRWSESFLGGVFCGGVAPFCWGLDLLTGTAWSIKSLENHPLPSAPSSPLPAREEVLAIAPPQANDVLCSDQVGEWLETRLIAKGLAPGRQLLPYEQSNAVFEDHQYTHEGRVENRENRIKIVGSLGATQVLESEVSENGRSEQVKWTIRDAFTDQILKQGEQKIPAELTREHGSIRHWAKSLSSDLIPNTVGLDAGSHYLSLGLRDLSYELPIYTQPQVGWMGEVSKFLGTIRLTNLRPPRTLSGWDVHFRIVPLFSFSFDNYSTEEYPFSFPETVNIEWAQVRGGLGPHLEFETPIAVIYLELGAVVGYSRLKWSTATRGNVIERGSTHALSTIGIYRYFSSRLALGLFVRTIGEDERMWSDVLTQSQLAPVDVEHISDTLTGLSVLYYFPEPRRWLRR